MRTLERQCATLLERERELRCLHAVERALDGFDDRSSSSLRDVAGALCDAFAKTRCMEARIRLGDHFITTPGFHEREPRISCPVVASGLDVGEIAVVSTAETSPEDDAPYSVEKRELVSLVAARLGEAWWRRHQTDQLQLLGTALHAAANAIVITDRDGNILWVNPAFCESSGYTSEEAIGRNPRELIASGEQNEAFYGELWQTILNGKVWRGELVNRRKDGSLYREAQTITPVRDRDDRISHFIAVKVDITEQVELREEFLQAQKMEAVGRLAGGIAHDFNNLLTVIRGHSEIILEEMGPDSRHSQDLREVLAEIARAGELTRQLLGFSRKQVMLASVFDMCGAAAALEPMLRRLLPERIALHFSTNGPLPIRADPDKLRQMLLNLAVNAGDSIVDVGTITLTTGRRELSAASADGVHWRVEAGTYAQLSVEDTGTGMPADVCDRIFEPFFTTKPEGRGTGLGLPMVMGIMKQSGGHVLVESEPGRGTVFHLLFPLLDEREVARPGEEPQPQAADTPPGKTGGETVLLVEDSSAVRAVATRVLERAGYVVLVASDGPEALEVARRHRDDIDLVLSDIVMPGMGGSEFVERVRQLLPHRPIVLMSGYSEEELTGRTVHQATRFLEKPFSSEELVGVVADALEMRR